MNKLALNLLRKTNYDTSKLRSKSWDEFATPDAPPLDFVFTVCDDAANEVCPIWPGQPMSAHWGLPDPAKATGNDAERAFRRPRRGPSGRVDKAKRHSYVSRALVSRAILRAA